MNRFMLNESHFNPFNPKLPRQTTEMFRPELLHQHHEPQPIALGFLSKQRVLTFKRIAPKVYL